MTKASDNVFPKVIVLEGTAPSSPSAGNQTLYIDSADHKLKRKNSSGTVTTIEAAAGVMASDTLWDAKGDLAAGTGADTASKLTVGSNGALLFADSSQSTGLKWAVLGSASYKRNTGDYTTTSTSFVDVDSTNMSLTITTGARRVLVGFTGNIKSSVASGGTSELAEIDLLVDGSTVGGSTDGILGLWLPSTAARFTNFSFTWMTDVLSAGSHTFKLQWRRSLGSGTLSLAGTSTGPVAQFWVAEQPF